MRTTTLCLALAAAVLSPGCSDSIEDDLELSGEEIRKKADKMSVAELERKLEELEAYVKRMEKEVGEGEPSEAEMKRAAKLFEVTGLYSTALLRKKME